MKFSSEFEMCKAVTIILSGLLLPIRHKHIPEVPRSSQNNHGTDNRDNENGVEFHSGDKIIKPRNI